MTEPITSFTKEYRWLSNFHRCWIKFDGVIYPSTEHAYQAAKTLNPEERKTVQQAPTPKAAKRAGYTVTLRPDWEDIKVQVMYDFVYAKFTQDPELQQKLLDTGDAELIEINPWGDTFWGVCEGKGENHLGKILMAVRTKIKETQS